MKRKIGAVLMVTVEPAAPSRSGGEAPSDHIETCRSIVRDVVRASGGEFLDTHDTGALLAAYQSAVAVMRASVEMQETLRVRNKALAPAERPDIRLGIAIGEVPAGKGEVPEETAAAVAALAARAAPGGLCISRSVREAVAGKINLAYQPVAPDGTALDGDAPAPYRVAVDRLERKRRPWLALPSAVPLDLRTAAMATAAAALLAAVAGFVVYRPGSAPQPASEEETIAAGEIAPVSSVEAATPDAAAAARPEGKGKGTLVFKPAHAPDPSAVLSAKRMLPNAWRDCERGAPGKAVDACQLLIESGLAKDAELAEYHLLQGRALRDSGDFDQALTAMNTAISIATSSTAFALRGTVHYKKKDLERAIADYSEAIRRDPGNAEALNNRAWTYYRLGRNREGLPDADTAVRLLGKEAFVWDTRAHIHAALGNRDAAIADFRKALSIDPDFADSKAGLERLGAR